MQKEITDEKINLVLRRAENMVNEDSIRKRLKSGNKLIIKFGSNSNLKRYICDVEDKNLNCALSSQFGFTGCKENNIMLNHFSFRDNGLKCESCSRQDKGAIEISEATVNAIKYIVLAPPKKLFSFNLSENGIKELDLIGKIYLNEKLDKEYKFEKLF